MNESIAQRISQNEFTALAGGQVAVQGHIALQNGDILWMAQGCYFRFRRADIIAHLFHLGQSTQVSQRI